jgi:hypothetical protein
MRGSESAPSIGVLWRAEPRPASPPAGAETRLNGVFSALELLQARAVAVPFSDDEAEAVRAELLGLDGVLVWVDPIMGERDRSVLDALLRDVAREGVWVSADPEVIRKMGTKEVLYATRGLEWGTDTALYASPAELRERFPEVLGRSGPRVLKQYRGNGGNGVWRVELAAPARGRPGGDRPVKVLHALRGSVEEEMPLAELMSRLAPYFEGEGRIIDQAFQPRLADGMVRCYLAGSRVVGFGQQHVTALLKPQDGSPPPAPPPRVYFGPDKPEFQRLREKLESQWVAEMQRVCEVDDESLPAIWDADFLYGPKDADGEDAYVLCEINVSSVFPIPEEAFGGLAEVAVRRSGGAGG